MPRGLERGILRFKETPIFGDGRSCGRVKDGFISIMSQLTEFLEMFIVYRIVSSGVFQK